MSLALSFFKKWETTQGEHYSNGDTSWENTVFMPVRLLLQVWLSLCPLFRACVLIRDSRTNVYVRIKRQHLTYILTLGYSALWPSLNSNIPKGLLWIHSIHQCLPASLEPTAKLPMIKMYWNAMGSYVAPQKRLCPLLLNFTKLLLIPSKPRA